MGHKVRFEGKGLRWMEGERGVPEAPWKQKGGSQCLFQVLVGLEMGENVDSKSQRWIKAWPAAPPAKPPPWATQIPEFNVLKPGFQK